MNDDEASPDEVAANARLCAAAPDLLEALRRFAAYPRWSNTFGGLTYVASVDDLKSARAAIAKAEGRS